MTEKKMQLMIDCMTATDNLLKMVDVSDEHYDQHIDQIADARDALRAAQKALMAYDEQYDDSGKVTEQTLEIARNICA